MMKTRDKHKKFCIKRFSARRKNAEAFRHLILLCPRAKKVLKPLGLDDLKNIIFAGTPRPSPSLRVVEEEGDEEESRT
jgi:hypothetical protein